MMKRTLAARVRALLADRAGEAARHCRISGGRDCRQTCRNHQQRPRFGPIIEVTLPVVRNTQLVTTLLSAAAAVLADRKSSSRASLHF